MFLALIKGFFTSASLIVAIGAQNAFVIRQGLLRRHLFTTALLCSVIDAALILFGVLGFGKILVAYPMLIAVFKYFAICFLFLYGGLALKSAFTSKSIEETSGGQASWMKSVVMILGFSLLNPHVYLDTVILLGSVASQQADQVLFALGAISASFSWFFAITYGSRLLAPFLRKKNAWKIIDILIALTMWGIAGALL